MTDNPAFVERIPAMAAIIDLDEVNERQIYFPDLDDDGRLILLPGEQIITTFEGVALGADVGQSPVLSAKGTMSEVDSVVTITNQRLVMVASKYDKGGGWDSESILAFGVLNAASKIRAKVRSRGKALVAQVRWPWLVGMRYRPKTGVVALDPVIELRCEQIVVTDGKPTPTSSYLAIRPHRRVDLMATAKTIFDAAIADRLSEGLDEATAKRVQDAVFESGIPGRMEHNTVTFPGPMRRTPSTAHHGRFTSLDKREG